MGQKTEKNRKKKFEAGATVKNKKLRAMRGFGKPKLEA